MKMNPRQIAKLCKHLRDAGAVHVSVAPDGTVNATFPQPNQFWVNPPWWYQPQPFWLGSGYTVTYSTDTPTHANGDTQSDFFVDGQSQVPENFIGYNQTFPVGQTITLTPES
jgi:hypothetical protein